MACLSAEVEVRVYISVLMPSVRVKEVGKSQEVSVEFRQPIA